MTQAELMARLHNLYEFVWVRDVPSHLIPEHKEHHRDIQEILTEILDLMKAISEEVDNG